MRVLGVNFGNPLTDRLDPDPEEPIGLEYVLGALAEDGHDVALYPECFSKGDLAGNILSERPDVVLLQVYTADVPSAIELSKKLKEKNPHLTIIAGGYHPTALPESFLVEAEGAIDYCVIAEGEATARELLHGIETGCDTSEVRGICYINGGSPKRNRPRELIHNINSIPRPIREPKYYDLETSGFYYPESSKVRFAPVVHSRGCTNSCTFCSSYYTWGLCPRFREPAEVVDEMNYLYDNHGINMVFIEDHSINLDYAKSNALFAEMKARLYENVHWGCCANIGIDSESLRNMEEAHCVCVSYGVESLDPDSLRATGKKQGIKQIKDTLESSAQLGLINYVFYMIGFENETEESIIKATEGLPELPIHRLRLTVVTPLPGSPYYDHIDKNRLDPDWSKYDTSHPVVLDHQIPPEHLEELREEITKRFYKSRGYEKTMKDFLRANPRFRKSYGEFRDKLKEQGYV
jgi:anaerobic magnesium-protoporphyrin IX monomethyl ester cyclase